MIGRRPAGTGWFRAGLGLALASTAMAGLAGCANSPTPRSATADPAASVTAVPPYLNWCAPLGEDDSPQCLGLALGAVDHARRLEGLGPMVLPGDFARLSTPVQVFIVVDRERIDRGLQPFAGLAVDLDRSSAVAARHQRLPAQPRGVYRDGSTEWIGGAANGLDIDYGWLYDDGPGSGVPGCSAHHRQGCWGDRQIILDRFGHQRRLVMGAAMVVQLPDRHSSGGTSFSAAFAATTAPVALAYTWTQALAAMRSRRLPSLSRPLLNQSLTGVADPSTNVAPVPNFANVCAPSGVDSSPACIASVLAAINHARGLEGVKPMVLPGDFARLSVPEQLFVAIDRERVDRGLSPFVGLTVALDANAEVGARTANDPPATAASYPLTDGEWAGGSSNGLDAVYGWMYQDGYHSGNLDCPTRHAAGCWGHRQGILDDFGTGTLLVMGAALDPTGDSRPDRGGTSMAATLALSSRPVTTFLYTWRQALADTP